VSPFFLPSVPVVSKREDYDPRTPPVSKASRTSQSSGGSSSGKKMAGFGANVEDRRALLMQAKREGSKSRKGKRKYTVLQGHDCADGI